MSINLKSMASKKNKRRKPLDSGARREPIEGELVAPRRDFTKWVLGGVGISALGGVGGYLHYNSQNESVEQVERPVRTSQKKIFDPKSVLTEDLDFSLARKHPELRQKYLDKILDNKDEYGKDIWGWNEIGWLIYDPGFKKLKKEYFEKLTYFEKGTKHYSLNFEGASMVTPAVNISWKTNSKGKNSEVYLREPPFLVRSENDLLSELDNESFHTGFNKHGKFSLNGVDSRISLRWPNAHSLLELMSFDHQAQQIIKGKRKVSDEFLKDLSGASSSLFGFWENLARSGKGTDGKVAIDVMNHLHKNKSIYLLSKH